MDLTDEQWLQLKPLFSTSRPRFILRRAGRPRLPPRPLLDGLFWKLRSASPWYCLPEVYPAWQTCYTYYRAWQRSGLLDAASAALLADLRRRGGLDLSPYLPIGALAFLRFGSRGLLQSGPQWERTWQLSTALLLFALLAQEARRRIPSLSRCSQEI